MKAEVIFSQHNTFVRKSFGEQKMIVECIATINGEDYKIEYYRSPITGELQSVTCEPKNETTENTLTIQAVEDYCTDELTD